MFGNSRSENYTRRSMAMLTVRVGLFLKPPGRIFPEQPGVAKEYVMRARSLYPPGSSPILAAFTGTFVSSTRRAHGQIDPPQQLSQSSKQRVFHTQPSLISVVVS